MSEIPHATCKWCDQKIALYTVSNGYRDYQYWYHIAHRQQRKCEDKKHTAEPEYV